MWFIRLVLDSLGLLPEPTPLDMLRMELTVVGEMLDDIIEAASGAEASHYSYKEHSLMMDQAQALQRVTSILMERITMYDD